MAESITASLLDVLAEAGARNVFGIVGDAINPFVDGVIADQRFRWFTVRHEENAAYAASAEAQLTGGIGVCAGTSGPGALHLINGLYNAKAEGAGVVAVTGQVPMAQRGSNFHKEMDLKKVFDDVCAYQAIIDSPEKMPRMVETAVQMALTDHVVTRIEIPANIIGQDIASEHYRRPLVHSRSVAVPDKALLEQAAEAINKGKRVALFCGVGCRGAHEQVLALARKAQAPIAHTFRAKDVLDYRDGPVVGLTGNIGNPSGFHAVMDCDVLVMLGTDFPYDEFLPDGRPIIQVDYRAEHIGRRAPVTVGLVGDVKATLEALLPLIEDGQSGEFRDHLLGMRDKWLERMSDQASLSRKDEPIHPQLFARAISDQAAVDALFAVDVGECSVWVARQMSMAGRRRMVGGFNHGAIGAGLPAALGAAAVADGRQVWALCGDGGFGMSMNDFITAARYGWPIKVIVFNNSEFGFVKMEMEVSGLAHDFDATGLVNPDFAAFAKACGGDGVRVEHVDDILPAIKQAIQSDKPFIIDAVVSPGELVMPPEVKIDEAWGFAMSKVKEGLLGLKGDHDVWKEWRNEFKAKFF